MATHIPFHFDRHNLTKVQAAKGIIYVRPMEYCDAFWVTATGVKGERIDAREIHGHVRQLVDWLGGPVRYMPGPPADPGDWRYSQGEAAAKQIVHVLLDAAETIDSVNNMLETIDPDDPEVMVRNFEAKFMVVAKVGPLQLRKTYWGGRGTPDLETGAGYWHNSPLDAATFTREQADQELKWLSSNYTSLGYTDAAANERVGIELMSPTLMNRWRKQREYQAKRKAERHARKQRTESADPDNPETFIQNYEPFLAGDKAFYTDAFDRRWTARILKIETKDSFAFIHCVGRGDIWVPQDSLSKFQ